MMFKTRAVLLGVLTLLIVSGTLASAASASGPYWRVNGARLGQGAVKQIKLQLKGGAVLAASEAGLEIECKNGVSEGGTIEGQGEKQGQGKGRSTFSQCKVVKPATGCKIVEPITSNPAKSYLATAETQSKIVSVSEPAQGNVFAVVKITGTCLQVGTYEMTGGTVAEIIPTGIEGQEGLVVMPSVPIEKIKHEGVEKIVKFSISGLSAKISGAGGARLATNERFGVFET